MSWLYSQALVEEYLAGNFSGGAQSAQSSGRHTQQAYLSPDKMMAFSHLSQSGMTYRPLTASHGKELLTSYLEAFHAKTSPQSAGVGGLLAKEVQCGSTWPESFAMWSPSMSLWKTAQCLLVEDSQPYLGTWPRWGLMRNGVCSELKPLALGTNATACGSWGTPTTSQDFKPVRPLAPSEANGTHGKILVGSIGKEHPHLIGRYLKPLVTEYLMGWPIGWTDLKPLAMAKFQPSQRQLGDC
jgi:hypothetical protein